MKFNYDKIDTSSEGFYEHLKNHSHLSFMNNLLSALLDGDNNELITQLLEAKVEEGSTLDNHGEKAISLFDGIDNFEGTSDLIFSDFYDALTNGDGITAEAAKTFKILQTSLTVLLGMTEDEINEYVLEEAAPEVVTEDAPTTVVETSPEVVAVTTPAPAVTTPAPAVTTPAPTVTTPAPAVTTPAPAVTTPAPAVTTPAPAVTTPAPAVTTPAPAVTTPAPAVTTPAPAVTTRAPAAVTTPVIQTLLIELHAARNSADKTNLLFRNKEHIKNFSAQEQFQLSEQISGDMVNLEVFNYFSDASVKATLSRKEVNYRSGIYF